MALLKKISYMGLITQNLIPDDSQTRQKAVTRVVNTVKLQRTMRQNKNSFDVVTELQKAYALVSTQPEAQDLSAEIAFFKTVKVF